MTVHTVEQTFGPYGPEKESALVTVKTNGGSLLIVRVMEDGTEVPFEDSNITADDSVRIACAGGEFKATPSGGCTYQWEY